LTSQLIAKAIADAHKRGVEVVVLLDSSENGDNNCSAPVFSRLGAKTLIDPNHAIFHNKVILIDGKTVITGSFNFSKAAEESNAENLLVIQDKSDLYSAYEKNFYSHLAHAAPYTGASEKPTKTQKDTTKTAYEGTSGNGAYAPPVVAPTSAAKTKGDAGASQDDPIVHITKSGKKYHRAGCRYLSKSDIPVNLSEAKARGYGPCSVCSPPE
jgi:hypothetical protein